MNGPCRYCEAVIRWVQLDSGKSMPVKPIPDDRGNVAARPQGTTLVGHVISREKPLQEGQLRYVPHRAHCDPDKPRVPRPDSLFDSIPEGDPA